MLDFHVLRDSGGGPSVARYGARHISARRIPSPSPASVAARSARSVPRPRAASPRRPRGVAVGVRRTAPLDAPTRSSASVARPSPAPGWRAARRRCGSPRWRVAAIGHRRIRRIADDGVARGRAARGSVRPRYLRGSVPASPVGRLPAAAPLHPPRSVALVRRWPLAAVPLMI